MSADAHQDAQDDRQAICHCGTEFAAQCALHGNAHQTHQDANLGAIGAGVASVPTVDAAAVLTGRHRRMSMGVCSECGRPWRGDVETGGCDAVLLARRVIALEAALAGWERWANPPFVPGAAWPVGDE